MINVIIGKRNNLSICLNKNLPDSKVFSVKSFLSQKKGYPIYLNKNKFNLIYNNFYKSSLLSNPKSFSDLVDKSIYETSKTLEYLTKNNLNPNKIIYTSSSSVYGNNKFCNEKDLPQTFNLQSSLKLANEELFKKFCYERNIQLIITRIFNMYGGNDEFSIISKILDSIKNKRKIIIYNKGKTIRDYVHIEDVTAAYIRILDRCKTSAIINIASGKGINFLEIQKIISKSGIKINYEFKNKNEVIASIADTSFLNKFINVSKFRSIKSFFEAELKI